jgi:hypothetical protein
MGGTCRVNRDPRSVLRNPRVPGSASFLISELVSLLKTPENVAIRIGRARLFSILCSLC